MDFILATNNMKKLAEMQRILSPLGINVVTAKMLGITLPEVVEDGDTFEANAKIKAESACKITGLPAIADDSGLCVDYLDGAPGIYSARFANIEVLFFDDLGTEIFTKNSNDTWLQGLLFDLINKRYNCKKATIFSSNHSLNELINERGIAEKTVDRISEMTSGAVMKIEGVSLRNTKKDCIF